MNMDENLLLAGDVGGTKTILALFSKKEGPYKPVIETIIQSAEVLDFCEVATDFLAAHRVKPAGCCFGVAGPVFDGKVIITKLGWRLTEEMLSERLSVQSAYLINDLAATAYALPVLNNNDLCVLTRGTIEPHGPITIIAPGTGLGEVFLTWDRDEYRVHSSEGGHALYAPVTPLHRELLEFLSTRQEQITYDLICSGRGIPLIYSFLRQKKYAAEPSWLAEELSRCDDQTPLIVQNALNVNDRAPISVKTIDIFLEILASEAANCALKILATGGVYLSGGMPPRLVQFLQKQQFLDNFTSRSPFHSFLANVPVTVVLNYKSALIGAACHGMRKLGWMH